MCAQASQIPFPSKLELHKGNIADNWKKFNRVWENYEIATGLVEKDAKLRIATLLTCLGSDAIELFETLTFEAEDDKKDIEKVIEAFNTYCVGETNETYERYVFNSRNQDQGENIDAYVSVLRGLAKTCNYGDLEKSLIRDRLVIGIVDNSVRRKLLQDKKLDLGRCIDMCRASEKTSAQIKTINQEEIAVVAKTFDKKKRFNKWPLRDCWFCGQRHEARKESCPAWGKKCSKCGVMNHFAVKCKSETQTPKKQSGKYFKRQTHAVTYEDDSSDSDTGEECVLSVEESQGVDRYPKKLYAKVLVGEKQVKCQLDCGSTVNILSDTDYMDIAQDPWLSALHKCDVTLQMYNKTETKTLGKRKFKVTNLKNKKVYKLEFVIVQGPAKPLLGAQAVQAMHLITVNREHIMSVDTSQSLINEYEDVFTGEGHLPGQLHLEVNDGARPVRQPVRKVPIAVKPKLKKELQRLNKLGVIQPVDEPTDWISSMVVVMKSTNKVRLCIDPKPLNKELKRNNYPIPTIEDILPELKNARIFTVADAKNGFWHVELDEESSYLTTFGTPWGRYRWNKMPFGISPAPEEFQRRLDEALEGLDGIKAIHDDILVWGSGKNDEEALEDHDRKLRQLFDRCRKKNIRLNRDKLKLCQKEVVFMGHVISADGLKIDETKIQAITEMPTPTDKQGVQRLLGMVNYVQKFAPRLSSVTEPLRQLIKKGNAFCWDSVHDKCLQEVRTILSTTPVLKYFDIEKQTVLQCDASETGLGACLMQEDHPIVYASRALTPTEQNYAQIEKELLAIVFGVEKFEHYVYGRQVTIETDHKPLEIIHKKSLISAPKRLQRMLLKLQKFDLDITYKPGPQMYLADTLSRAYIPAGEHEQSLTEKEVDCVNMIELLPVARERIKEIQEKTATDPQLQKLMEVVRHGWPEEKSQLTEEVQKFFPFREEVTLQDGLLFKGDRVIIPTSLRLSVMERLHSSHMGIQGCLRRAREAFYWPNMNSDIEEYIHKCDTCNEFPTAQQKETLHSHEIPSRPFEVVGVDLFEYNNKDFVVTVDYYTNFFEVDKLDRKTAKGVIPKLKRHWARYGIPEKVITDNGPPFGGKEFQDFAKNYEFRHVTSSPMYPQSNGRVENAVKTAKRLMRKAKNSGSDPHLALLDFRNTPTEGLDVSPAQAMFGRGTRTLLPISNRQLRSLEQSTDSHRAKLAKNKLKQAQYYNRTAKDMKPLNPGDTVRVQPLGRNKPWKKAQVQDTEGLRSYRIRTEDGSSYRRNRKHLRATPEMWRERDPTSVEKGSQEKPQIESSSVDRCRQSDRSAEQIVDQPSIKVQEDHHSGETGPAMQGKTATTEMDGDSSSDGAGSPVYKTARGRVVRKPAYLQDFAT